MKPEETFYSLNTSRDLTPLIEGIGDASIVMLGEASHGTHEYYTWRTEISKRLITEKGFSFIAVEGDWPDCYRINSYVKAYPDADKNINDVLKRFNRWPTWMWANWEVAALAEWMRSFNQELPEDKRVGFYGLDVYSLWESMEAIVNYLEKEDPKAARTAREAIQCFEPFGEEGQVYAQVAASMSHTCKDEVLALLKEIRTRVPYYNSEREAALNAEQNALIAVNAEKYYRSMMGFDSQSWNIRDNHMMETLQRLIKFHGPKAKGIIWAHNTHIGDARATSMKEANMVNIGQLAREQYGDDSVFLVGFGSYKGTVIAGSEWGAPMKEMDVPRAREGSVEAILHGRKPANQLLLFDKSDPDFNRTLPHRAIGVVYHPDREKYGNYVPSLMSSRYDAFLFIDETKALHPFHLHPDGHKTPETYPFGL